MSKKCVGLTLVLLLALFVATSALVAAQTNGYSIERWTLDNGGGVSAAGPYSLSGTIGQPDASAALTGGTYSLTGGYWGIMASGYAVFLPVIVR